MIPAALATATMALLLSAWCGRGRAWRRRGRNQRERISGLVDENHTLHRDLADTQADRDFVIGRWWQTEQERDHARAAAHGYHQAGLALTRRLCEVSAELAAERQRVHAVDELAAKRVVRLANGRFAPKDVALDEARAAVAEAREALAVVDGAR